MLNSRALEIVTLALGIIEDRQEADKNIASTIDNACRGEQVSFANWSSYLADAQSTLSSTMIALQHQGVNDEFDPASVESEDKRNCAALKTAMHQEGVKLSANGQRLQGIPLDFDNVAQTGQTIEQLSGCIADIHSNANRIGQLTELLTLFIHFHSA